MLFIQLMHQRAAVCVCELLSFVFLDVVLLRSESVCFCSRGQLSAEANKFNIQINVKLTEKGFMRDIFLLFVRLPPECE